MDILVDILTYKHKPNPEPAVFLFGKSWNYFWDWRSTPRVCYQNFFGLCFHLEGQKEKAHLLRVIKCWETGSQRHGIVILGAPPASDLAASIKYA